MKCTGCFICCDESIRSNFPEIKEIEIIGCETFEFNGVYTFNGFYNLKPQYIKKNGNNNTVEFYSVHNYWSIHSFNSRSNKILHQKITCPMNKWKEKYNDHSANANIYCTIKTPFYVVNYSNVVVKPAKLFE